MVKSEHGESRYIIIGAGAVGCAVGGLLVKAGRRVVLIARPAIANAVRTGFTVRLGTSETQVTAPAVTALSELEPLPGDVVVLTMKSQGTELALQQVSEVYGSDTPIVCLQNGVFNEEATSRQFINVYGGFLFLFAVQLRPELVTLPLGNTIAIGLYPKGSEPTAARFVRDLARAGFDAFESEHILALKWAKLVANLNNATQAITGYWMERSMSDCEMRELMFAVREEGLRVLDAAGIAVEPPAGHRDPNRIRETTLALKRPPSKSLEESLSLPPDRRSYSSLLQDFYNGRKSTEVRYLNGEIVALGAKLGIATPYNTLLMETVERMSAEGLEPGVYTPRELSSIAKGKTLG
ncbi:MAG TPA: 2-dehydropantoate 2-reductase [Blastocatellia bacterium]|nr:2-dehydropantoate 2-reductase [Blastocatellia bacterium]